MEANSVGGQVRGRGRKGERASSSLMPLCPGVPELSGVEQAT